MTNMNLPAEKTDVKEPALEKWDSENSSRASPDSLGSDTKAVRFSGSHGEGNPPPSELEYERGGSFSDTRALYDVHHDFQTEDKETLGLNEEAICHDDQTSHSIFDLPVVTPSKISVNLPQIITVFASSADKNLMEKEAKNCVLPCIQGSTNNAFTGQIPTKPLRARRTSQLFDFRAANIQKIARTRQIKRLKKRGYGTGCDSSAISRFVSSPYEGACDDISAVPKIPGSSPKNSKKQSSENKKAEVKTDKEAKALSPPADEETIAKVESAYNEWQERKQKQEEELLRFRKRSSSHSPTRSSTPVGRGKKLSSSHSGSIDFLNHKGNLRQRPLARPATGHSVRTSYQAVGSPATFRKRLDNNIYKVRAVPHVSVVSTTIKVLPESPRSPATGLRSARKTLAPAVLKNKRLAKIRSAETEVLSSSLPNLSLGTNSAIVEHSGHRPRSSSVRKSAASKPVKSPKALGKSNLTKNKRVKQNAQNEKQISVEAEKVNG